MRGKHSENAVENLATHRIHGILPKKYHMQYRSGKEELIEEKSLKEIEQLICQCGGEMDVPEGLLPENMARKLDGIRRGKKRRQRVFLAAGTLLAVCVVIFAVLAWKNHQPNISSTELSHIYSYSQLYHYYEKLADKQEYYPLHGSLGALMSSGTASSSSQMTSTDSGAVNTTDTFTSTNVREKGIGEGDFTTTDGEYIYTVRHLGDGEMTEVEIDEEALPTTDHGFYQHRLEITISRMEGKEVETVATLLQDYKDPAEFEESQQPPILYLYGDTLVLIYSDTYIGESRGQKTCLNFYDVSDRSNPKLIKESVQNGWYQECREVDGFLYVISTKPHIMVKGERGDKEELYVPMIDDEKLPVQDIYLQEDAQGTAYELISSWDLSKPGERTDAKALIGYYQDVYMTAGNIYFSGTVYAETKKRDKTDSTQVFKLSCKQGKIQAVAMTKFPGIMDSSFAIQEHGEELWVTAQVRHYVYEKDSDEAGVESWIDVSVYTFDHQLNRLDSLDGLVKDETIYAVRYIGETGYFVSYEQTDPLVSIDFSDSRHLKLLDELVMPGLSMYLHPAEDNLLLGVGLAEDNDIKLDLYDISDPKKLFRLDKEVLDRTWLCAVFNNYRWFMVDEENQLFGLCVYGAKDMLYYYVYHYDREKGLQQIKRVELQKVEEYGYNVWWQGFHIGDYLYLVGQSEKQGIRVVEL